MKKVIYYVFSLLKKGRAKKKKNDIAELSEKEKNLLVGKRIKNLIFLMLASFLVSVFDVTYYVNSYRLSGYVQVFNAIIGFIVFYNLYQIYLLTDKIDS